MSCLLTAAFLLGCHASEPSGPTVGGTVRFNMTSVGDVARAVYDIRVYTTSDTIPGSMELIWEALGVNSNGPAGTLARVAPCEGARDPGRLGLLEISATAYDAAGNQLGPRQTQSRTFYCIAGEGFIARDNVLEPFIFTFVIPAEQGFADIVVIIEDLRLAFKVDIVPLFLTHDAFGDIVRARTAVTGLSVGGNAGGAFPSIYFLAKLVTGVTCLYCRAAGSPGPLLQDVFSGIELPTAPSRAKYLNTIWQMPELGLTTNGDWTLEAAAVMFYDSAVPSLRRGAPYIHYGVATQYDSASGYATQKEATIETSTAIARAVEGTSEHVYIVRDAEVTLPGGSTVPGLNLIFSRDTTADTGVNVLERASYFARSGGLPIAARPVRVEFTTTDGTRFNVVLEVESTSSTLTLAQAKCEVSLSNAGCEAAMDGTLVLYPVALGGGAP